MISQLLFSLLSTLNNIAARLSHLHYCACVKFILFCGRCRSSCFEDLRGLQMKWENTGEKEGALTAGDGEREHKAR